MDVKIAFFNGNLYAGIYMMQSDSFVTKGQKHMVCKLKKSIYEFKQAFRSWNLILIKQVSLLVLINALMSRMCIKNVMKTWWCSWYCTWMISCSSKMMWGYYLR